MRYSRLLVCVLGIGLGLPGRSRAGDALPQGTGDLPSKVRAVFSAKCAGCHGATLAKPKGRFGYVLDLERVANNREMIVPGSPAESELWQAVQHSEMPPADSPTGALTASEKEVIEKWIQAGAPAETSGRPPEPPLAQPSQAVEAGPTSPAVAGRLMAWLGNFHLLALHFPIALLLAAALGEFWSVVRRSDVPAPAVRFCVDLGATAAVITVALGWLHALAGHGASMPQVLALHRWLGTTVAVWASLTAVQVEWDQRTGVRRLWTRLLLFVGALLTAVAAHFGGTLAQGEGFWAW
jgi:uncharacterized membrane protein/mono/diheme cytochrome c family protein